MRSLILAAFVSGCVTPAPAVEWDGERIKLNPDELKRCQNENGCAVITIDMLRRLLEAAQMCLRKSSV